MGDEESKPSVIPLKKPNASQGSQSPSPLPPMSAAGKIVPMTRSAASRKPEEPLRQRTSRQQPETARSSREMGHPDLLDTPSGLSGNVGPAVQPSTNPPRSEAPRTRSAADLLTNPQPGLSVNKGVPRRPDIIFRPFRSYDAATGIWIRPAGPLPETTVPDPRFVVGETRHGEHVGLLHPASSLALPVLQLLPSTTAAITQATAADAEASGVESGTSKKREIGAPRKQYPDDPDTRSTEQKEQQRDEQGQPGELPVTGRSMRKSPKKKTKGELLEEASRKRKR
ncbi:hypothetical protein LTR85_008679 [Meristemomyces frigidus]|nr:hypothetical protein LTR85_008679 [Meristemomyces frigidus]